MEWGYKLVEAEDQRYWDLLAIYLLVRAVLGDGDLAQQLSQALDDGDPHQVEAALAHYASQPPHLRARVETGESELDYPLLGSKDRRQDQYWTLLMLYLRVGAELGECPLYDRMGKALDDGSDARIVSELVYFESLPEPLKTSIWNADTEREEGLLPKPDLPPSTARTVPIPFWGRAAGRVPAEHSLRRAQ